MSATTAVCVKSFHISSFPDVIFTGPENSNLKEIRSFFVTRNIFFFFPIILSPYILFYEVAILFFAFFAIYQAEINRVT